MEVPVHHGPSFLRRDVTADTHRTSNKRLLLLLGKTKELSRNTTAAGVKVWSRDSTRAGGTWTAPHKRYGRFSHETASEQNGWKTLQASYSFHRSRPVRLWTWSRKIFRYVCTSTLPPGFYCYLYVSLKNWLLEVGTPLSCSCIGIWLDRHLIRRGGEKKRPTFFTFLCRLPWQSIYMVQKEKEKRKDGNWKALHKDL